METVPSLPEPVLSTGLVGSPLWADPQYFGFKTVHASGFTFQREAPHNIFSLFSSQKSVNQIETIDRVISRQELYQQQMYEFLGFPSEKGEEVEARVQRGLKRLKTLLAETSKNFDSLKDNPNALKEYKLYVLMQLVEYRQNYLSETKGNIFKKYHEAVINNFFKMNYPGLVWNDALINRCKSLYLRETSTREIALLSALENFELLDLHAADATPKPPSQPLLEESQARKMLSQILKNPEAKAAFLKLQEFFRKANTSGSDPSDTSDSSSDQHQDQESFSDASADTIQ